MSVGVTIIVYDDMIKMMIITIIDILEMIRVIIVICVQLIYLLLDPPGQVLPPHGVLVGVHPPVKALDEPQKCKCKY